MANFFIKLKQLIFQLFKYTTVDSIANEEAQQAIISKMHSTSSPELSQILYRAARK